MASMVRVGFMFAAALAATTGASAQLPPPAPSYVAPATADIGYALADWRRLRSSDGYAFADYARFLVANPDWPEDARLRRAAERNMRAGESPQLVASFFRTAKPRTGNGWTRLAESLTALGRPAEAAEAARNAWASADLSPTDQSIIQGRYWSAMSTTDSDKRADALLFAKKPDEAERAMAYASPGRRAAFAARIAMQRSSPDADSLYRAVDAQLASDAGLLMDRLRFLKDTYNNVADARALAARPHRFTYRPADPERFLDMLLVLAQSAYAAGNYQQAYDIARQVDDSLASGTAIPDQSYAVRDDYTSLTWLAGTAALSGTRRYADAAREFVKYSNGGKSLQVTTKGLYWAGRALSYAGRAAEANAYFERAAAFPELFYGQLSLERLGRPVPPPAALPALLVSPQQQASFRSNRLARATAYVNGQGRRDEATLFVRALSESLDSTADRIAGAQFGQQIGRPDLAVWIARSARNNGAAFYYRPAFPTHQSSSATGKLWSLVHGITRQESSFDRSVISHAGARGLMQLMPATASLEARKAGVGYDGGRLLADPSYNVMLGSQHFARLLNNYDGNNVLAIAAYNAGPGNVNKWLARFGDPRRGVDVLQWIERIPFMETRGYVQRVLENSVVYDRINPTTSQSASLSTLLGKSRPG